MPYVNTANSFRWVDSCEGYELKPGECFSDTPCNPELDSSIAKRQQIAELERQFTTTMQMGVVLGVEEDIQATQALYSQIEALKAEL